MIEDSSQSMYNGSSSVFAERWEEAYDTITKVDRQHFWHVCRNERIYSLLKQFEPDYKNKKLLELGCGNANVVGYMWEQGVTECTGWELNPYALELAKKRYPSIRFEQKNFLEEEQQEKSVDNYDIVGLFDLLEHLPDDVNVLRRIGKWLKPKGRVVLTVPGHQQLWSAYDDFYGHLRRYSKSQLLSCLEQAGYTQIHGYYFMAALVPPLLLTRKSIAKTTANSDSEMLQMYKRESNLPPLIINELAKLVLRSEQSLLGQKDLGFGSSIIATAIMP